MAKKKNEITIRSSAAEYLTYVAAIGDNLESIEVRYEDENIWLTQKMLSTLYGVSISAINQHIKKIYDDNELDENSTIKNFLIVQKEGNRDISRNVVHYNLQMIIAIGFKVDNERAIHFRKWANQVVKDYTIKGWVMDDERLKSGGSILTEKYFEEQLERIREIRMSERKFYQKITDIYATSIDYDKTAKSTISFFTSIQNKLHYAASGNTAAEIIYNRADHKKENMGLTSWEGSPNSKIHKYDVGIAKNYLSETEIGQLERMVSAYLDLAEMQAMRHIPMTMADWEERLNGFLKLWDHEVLKDNGKITAEMAKIHAETEFEKYRIIQDQIYISDFDELLLNAKKIGKENTKGYEE
ncbi:MAG: virulence RhuM family protein [Bacilli bacterium]|nr:virulence RhuM family protein [Bacilli bacterium]